MKLETGIIILCSILSLYLLVLITSRIFDLVQEIKKTCEETRYSNEDQERIEVLKEEVRQNKAAYKAEKKARRLQAKKSKIEARRQKQIAKGTYKWTEEDFT